LGAVTANSAFHGTRLDVEHIAGVMETVVRQGEARGADRAAMAAEMVFVSHETYTPARGGSAAAEIHALRHVFGGNADRIVIANTKGITGHPMGVGLEDVVAVKALETGIVPPVAASARSIGPRQPQPVARGAPVRYAALAVASAQIAMALLCCPVADGRQSDRATYRIADAQTKRWLDARRTRGAPEVGTGGPCRAGSGSPRLTRPSHAPSASAGAGPWRSQRRRRPVAGRCRRAPASPHPRPRLKPHRSAPARRRGCVDEVLQSRSSPR
jgi:hypothetical protein